MTSGTPTFIPYDQGQLSLLPPSLEDFVAKDHPARILNEIIEKIDITSLNKAYKSKGRASYHPKMLLKVLVYAYITNIYSSRKIEVACKENIHFMWLSGMSFPDHNTINRFRSERLAKHLRTVFDQIVLLLAEEGFLSIEEAYIDGTKIEANANKYTFVWKKSIAYYKEKMVEQLNTIWKYAQSVAKEEDDLPPPPEFKVIDKESIQQAIETLNEVLKDNPEASKEIKLKLKYANDNYPKKIEEYLEKEEILGDRNSYSKTDPDATFMRMKEDHMLNGQLKPGYNVQISSNNQFILNYTIHSNPTDTTTLQSHLDQYQTSFGTPPSEVIADAGYGSEQNYEFLENQNITAYVKFNTFDREQRKTKRDKDFTKDSLHYNSEKDCFICPMGQQMSYIGDVQRKTSNGYVQILKRYRTKNCQGCPLNGVCHKSKQNRTIEINTNLNIHRKKLLNF